MYARAFSVATPRELRDFTHGSVYVSSIVLEILDELKRGVTPRELALRYSISEAAVYNYRAGRRFGLASGRPCKLSKTEQRTIFEAYTAHEATVLELAAIYRVPPMNIRRVIKRLKARRTFRID